MPKLSKRAFLMDIVKRHKLVLVGIFLINIYSTASWFIAASLIGYGVEHAVKTGRVNVLITLVALAILNHLIAWVSWGTAFTLTNRYGRAEENRQRIRLGRAILDPSSRPDDRTAGQLLTLMTSDTTRVVKIMWGVQQFLPTTVTALLLISYLTYLNPFLGLTLIAGIAVLVVVTRVITPLLTKRHTQSQAATADASSMAADLITGLRSIQGLGMQENALTRYRETSAKAKQAAIRNARTSGFGWQLAESLSTLMVATVALIAAYLVLNQKLGMGEFIIVIGTVSSLMSSLWVVSEFPVFFGSILGSTKRLVEFYQDAGVNPLLEDARDYIPGEVEVAHADRNTEPRMHQVGTNTAANNLGSLQFKHVHTEHVNDLDLELKPGQITAIACSTQIQSSELLQLIDLHPQRPVSGTVNFAGQPFTAEVARTSRAVMLQQPHVIDLFQGSLADQVLTKAPRQDQNTVYDALTAASADDIITLLSDGIDTEIVEGGKNLSGGQRQRTALARALAADMPYLVLHDPTTAVDSVTEQQIAQGIQRVRREGSWQRTLIFTTAPALLAISDEVYFVAADGTVSLGTHHELAQENENYSKAVLR